MASAAEVESDRGSVALESIFAIVLLMVIALGTMQVAFLLFARNSIQASAHEAARVAIERGADISEARSIAGRLVDASVGGMVNDLRVDVLRDHSALQQRVTVVVRASVRPSGPVPFEMPVRATARLSTVAEPR